MSQGISRAVLASILERQAEESIGATDLLPRIRARLLDDRAKRSSRRLLVRTGRIGLALAGLTLLTAAAYAGVSRSTDLADRMWHAFRGSGQQEGEQLVGVSQTINGVRVTVDRVIYDGHAVRDRASANEPVREIVPVYVEFTVSGLPTDTAPRGGTPGPAAGSYSVRETITASDGKPLQRVGGVGLSGASDLMDRTLPPGVLQQLFAYDTSGQDIGGDGFMRLRLEVTVVGLTRAGDPATSPTSTDQPGLLRPTPHVTDPTPLAGPFILDFAVQVR